MDLPHGMLRCYHLTLGESASDVESYGRLCIGFSPSTDQPKKTDPHTVQCDAALLHQTYIILSCHTLDIIIQISDLIPPLKL